MLMMYARNLVDLHLKYYTDAHDVDEDLRTISFHGGMFIDGRQAGVTQRYTRSDVSHSSDAVASSDIRKISNYTDNHDVDESVMTISMHSGYWVDHTFAGITHRDMGGTSSYVSSHVAYKCNKNSTLITGVEF